jgi:hypothetical protein
MTQPVSEPQAAKCSAPPARLTVEWARQTNEEQGATRWFGSWILTADGTEGAWFYSGHGGERTVHEVPAGATGVRIRRWTSEGLDPEYVDLPLDGEGERRIRTAALDFDTPQPHRLLRRAEA